MLFDTRTVLCADFSGAPKLPPITFVRAHTLFVVETQYTPKRSDADHSPIRGRTIHRLKITGSAPEPASSRGSRVRKLKMKYYVELARERVTSNALRIVTSYKHSDGVAIAH